MRERKVYGLLALLTREEHALLIKYLGSDLFEASKTLQVFFQLWLKKVLLPDLEGLGAADFSPEEFMDGTKLLPGRIDKYCSQLYKVLLDFFAFRHFQQSGSLRLEFVADELEKRGAPRKEWEAQRERLLREINATKLSSEKFYRQLQFQWKDAEARIHSRETQSLWKEDFRSLHEATDRYYYLQKLKLACATANARLIYNHPREHSEAPGLKFLENLDEGDARKLLDSLGFSYWLTLKLYYSEDGSREFDALFAHLQVFGALFEKKESLELFHYALNYCLRKGNKGEAIYLKYSAALYRELLDNKIILIDGKLPAQAMKNIVVIHCLVGDLDWAESFIDAYQDQLQGEKDPNVIKYNRAVLAFYRQDPDSISLFQEVISQLKGDVFYELDSRTYLIKAYYQHLDGLSMEEIDDMYRMYDSFRIFISRNQMISEMHKQRYHNFIVQFRRFLKLLESSQQVPDRDRLLELRDQIKSAEFMANKSWFLEKLGFYLEPA